MENKRLFSVTPLISDHAVLQRNEKIVVRGRGCAGLEATAELMPDTEPENCTEPNARTEQRRGAVFQSERGAVKAAGKRSGKDCMVSRSVVRDDGTWRLEFPPLPAGGPYRLYVRCGGETLEFADIFIGDVWLLAGQSNMQLPMERVKYRYPMEYREGASTLIRQFTVPIRWEFGPGPAELSGGEWKTAAAEHIPVFSAVGFFFGKKLYERYCVPVGLVLTAVGGTPVQAWMSREALLDYPDELRKAEACGKPGYVEQIQQDDEKRTAAWWRRLDEQDRGMRENWAVGADDGSDAGLWKKINLSDSRKLDEELRAAGTLWLRRHVDIPADLSGKPVRISLGTITDADFIYVNGELSGSTAYRYPPREYKIPALAAGDNVLVLRVLAVHGQGGFTRGKKHRIIWEDGTEINISKGWECRRGAVMEPLNEKTFFERMPLGMYQGMIAPLHDFSLRGICWYQGEMNADEYGEYPGYFSRLLSDWREKWRKPKLPVLFVQLPCYDLEDAGNWVEFREMQRGLTVIPDTAMVVTMDCGEENDLHPVNKSPVGERLAMAAFQMAYGESGAWLSPVFSYGEREENGIVLHFEHADDGLKTVDGETPKGFEYLFFLKEPETETVSCIRLPAEVSVKGGTVTAEWPDRSLYAETLPYEGKEWSCALVYAWSNRLSGSNLCNCIKLPVSPFLYWVEKKIKNKSAEV